MPRSIDIRSLVVACFGAVSFSACAVERGLPPQVRSAAEGAGNNHERSATRFVGCSSKERLAPPVRTLRGQASYYHDSLAGNHTANGEIYDPKRISAAHRRLPFGTRVRVVRTDMSNPLVLCVSINDRGPFAGRERIIDLSRKAAEQLQMIRAGVVPVRVEVLKP